MQEILYQKGFTNEILSICCNYITDTIGEPEWLFDNYVLTTKINLDDNINYLIHGKNDEFTFACFDCIIPNLSIISFNLHAKSLYSKTSSSNWGVIGLFDGKFNHQHTLGSDELSLGWRFESTGNTYFQFNNEKCKIQNGWKEYGYMRVEINMVLKLFTVWRTNYDCVCFNIPQTFDKIRFGVNLFVKDCTLSIGILYV